MKKLMYYYRLFYEWVGVKILLYALLVLFTTFIDGFGLSMALPILEFDADRQQISKYSDFVYRGLESFGIDVSIVSLVVFIIIIFFIKAILKLTQESIGIYMLYNMLKSLRFDIVERYRKIKYSFFVNTEIGYFNNIITTEIKTTISAFRKFVVLLTKSVMAIVYISFAFTFNQEISVIIVVSIFIIYFVLKPMVRKIKSLSKTIVDSNVNLQNAFIQFILNFKYLKATANFQNPAKNIKSAIIMQYNKGLKISFFELITPITLELIGMILFSTSIIYLVVIKQQNISAIMVTILFLYKAVLRLPEFQSTYQAFIAQSASVDMVEEARNLMHKNVELFEGKVIKNFSSEIVLSNVSFSFGDKKILSNVNMTIPCKSTVGIVGESGSGKTTMVDIITGLLVPQSGKIEIDGIDYGSISKESLRNHFGYITQEPIIFNDTIFNNITLWSSKDNDKESLKMVEWACKIANCLDFIQETEQGFKSIVGDRGVRLSGGQRQRLSIAREIYRKTKITIFDEATSSLDTNSENLIQKSINNLVGKQTMILIAHRLSTVKNCNYIYVLDKGRIIQEGSWEILMSNPNSLFKKMCELQGIIN